jgi:hypothetical protein
MSNVPFTNVRSESPATKVSVSLLEQVAPVSTLDDARVNGDTSDVGVSHPPELPNTLQPGPVTNPGAGFKVRA